MNRLMRLSLLALAAGVSLGTGARVSSAAAQSDDRVQIAGVVRDYFEGWYTADAERLGRSLHPDMVKRYVEAFPGGRQVVRSATRDVMIEMTRMGGGSETPPERRNIVIDVLDLSGDIAVARASSSQYLEYLSLARCNGRWAIINILWRFQDAPAGHSREEDAGAQQALGPGGRGRP